MTAEKTITLTNAQIALVKEWAQRIANGPYRSDTQRQEAREIVHACEDAERLQ